MKRHSTQQGFTLIETLVALALFSLSTYLIYGLINSMRFNTSTMTTVNASQAIQDVMERTAKTFSTSYGVLAATDAPTTLDRYNWSVTLCQVAPDTGVCTSPVTLTPAVAYAYTPSATATVLRMTVTYTPKTTGTGSIVKAATEFAKP